MCASFFPNNPWPNYEEYKQAMERWLNANHSNYLSEIGEIDWINTFSGKHHSLVIIVNCRQLMIQQILTLPFNLIYLFYNNSLCEK